MNTNEQQLHVAVHKHTYCCDKRADCLEKKKGGGEGKKARSESDNEAGR